MKNIIIIGSGGFAREVIWLIENINSFKIIGYVSESKEKKIKYPFLGYDDCLKSYSNKGIGLILAVGSVTIRKKIYDKTKDMIFEYPNIISKNSILGNNINLGQGNIICSGSILTTDIIIGSFNIINLNCTIGHDTIINDFITINPGSNISGNVIIENNCEIGTGTKVIQNICIKENIIIGAGSVLVRDTEPSSIYMGVPARKKRGD